MLGHVTDSQPFLDAMKAAAGGAEQLQHAATSLADPGQAMVAFAASEVIDRLAHGNAPDVVAGTAQALGATAQGQLSDQHLAELTQHIEAMAKAGTLPEALHSGAGLMSVLSAALPGEVGQLASLIGSHLTSGAGALGA
jgi:hypothetical protein